LEKRFDHRNAGDDQGDADNGGYVEFLTEENPGDGADQHDPCPAPDSINDADGHRPQGERKKEKGDGIAGHHDDRRPQPGEAFAGFERRSGDHFGHDGDGEGEVGHGREATGDE